MIYGSEIKRLSTTRDIVCTDAGNFVLEVNSELDSTVTYNNGNRRYFDVDSSFPPRLKLRRFLMMLVSYSNKFSLV